jgi:hypothetical protein
VCEEDDHSDGAPLQAPRAPRNSYPRSAPNRRSTTKQRVFTRYEGIAIAAVIGLATQEKPFIGAKRIVRHARDYEKDPRCARLLSCMKCVPLHLGCAKNLDENFPEEATF